MNEYENTLDKLLKDQANIKESDNFFLTIYIPTIHKTRLFIRRKIKSLTHEAIKNHPILSQYDFLSTHLQDSINKQFNLIENITQGLGIFVKIDIDKVKSPDNIKIVNLNIKPKEETFIGEIYSLDNLIYNINNPVNAIIVQIQREEAKIFSIIDGNFSQVSKEKNELLEFDTTQRYKELSPYSDQTKYFSGGEYNLQRRIEDENHNFLNQVLDEIYPKLTKSMPFQYFIIFYSKNFSGFIDSFIENNKSKINIPNIITMEDTLNEYHELEIKTHEIINKVIKEKEKVILSESKENYTNFAKGWNEVIRSARMRKIDILFVDSKQIKDGYIDNNSIYNNLEELQFYNNIKESKHISNVIPWLIKNVVESSGKVIFTRSKKLGNGVNIAAKLRY